MTTIYKQTVLAAFPLSIVPLPNVDRLNQAAEEWAKEVVDNLDIITVIGTADGENVNVTFEAQDEEQAAMIERCLRELSIDFTASVDHEDEHDRRVDMRYVAFMQEHEATHDASFQDMAHALVVAQQAIQARIDYHQSNLDEWASTIHEYGALSAGGRKVYDNTKLEIVRLKMSHARLAELLMQRGDEDIFEGDGWLTRTIDIWIRG